MNHWQLLLLGLIAGGTIYIGLPLGRMSGLGSKVRSVLSMLSAGILVYLLVEILGEAAGETAGSVQAAATGSGSSDLALLNVILLMGGLLTGLVGLVVIQERWIERGTRENGELLSFITAAGIGLHNLSEGLAIGQSFAMGKSGLAMGLVIGFALHNATEGFGIVGSSVRTGARMSWMTILVLGAIGGGPTFVGTLLGSLWTSEPLSIFVLAMAGGAILYVVKELLWTVRKEAAQKVIMSALVLGFGLGWATEVAASAAQAMDNPSGPGEKVRDADGDVRPAAKSADSLVRVPAADATEQDRISDAVLHEQAMVPKTLPDGTKEFDLTASVFPWQLYPGKAVNAWGYNGQVPGPLIRVQVGDRVAIVLKNELPQPTTLHLHGLAVPNAMDGVPQMNMGSGTVGTQPTIPPGGSFTYKFTVTGQMIGTHLYHTHVNDDFQMDMGLHGVLIVDPPRTPEAPSYHVDALYELASFKTEGSEQENVFTLDGKAYPEAPVLNVHRGDRVLLRLVNASAEEFHVMHLHGYTFAVVARDGNPLPQPEYGNTVTLGPSQTADIAFTADNPGQWMFHCHILDHTINPGEAGDGSATHMAEMGGLMTFLNVQ
ncbi:MAG: multicopper oxidase domain-containing protein [Kyrpidia sp.]|nr:multicopper oxidase domain-containing protein [Kyrpidia sp.]